MTVADMRAVLGLASTVPDATVEAAWLAYVEGQPTPAEPISLAEAKANLRVTTPDEDGLIASLIIAARQQAENVTGLVLTPREVVQTARDFSTCGLDLYAWPVRSITSIGYIDTSGAPQTLASSAYVASLLQRPVRITPSIGSSWPMLAFQPAAVTVTMQAGYATPDQVPQAVKQAIHLLVGHWYSNRVAAEVGLRAAAIEIPLGATALLSAYRMWSV